jgi:hypothetical protein
MLGDMVTMCRLSSEMTRCLNMSDKIVTVIVRLCQVQNEI